ncbi:methyl-accepting chemotaxis protein, partial [Caldimonas mangrovi]|uniref:methyl-accepting chemotaxis protein n=1 Tax=Caldimonas mangrovi TaxID=2944811 RepID=UPI002175497D
MKSLGRLSIRTRLYFSTVFALVLLTLIGAMGYVALGNTRVTLDELLQRQVSTMVETGKLRTSMAQVRRIEKDMIIDHNNTVKVGELKEHWKQALEQTRAQLSELSRQLKNERDAALSKQALASLQQYDEGMAPIIEQIERAQIDGAAAGAYAERVKEHIETADKHMQDLAAALRQDMETAKGELDERTGVMSSALAGAIAVALLVMIPLTLFTVRSITGSLVQARDLAARIAQGDLSNDIATTQHDEIGQLVESMAQMQNALRALVSQVHTATDNITNASTEIASGNLDLSSRTEEAASSLQQTASSMEQLTGTVKQSADAARQANQLASSASSVASRGGQVVSQVVATMDEINTSSKKIADIIGVIDGIAFQTNILAL